MADIDKIIQDAQEKRMEKVKELEEKVKKLETEPLQQFEKEYAFSIESLAAKEGMGKNYGQPRRLAQERIRGEMSKCEDAQKGIDKLLERINNLCELAEQQKEFHKKDNLNLEIRRLLVCAIRCIHRYGEHLTGFSEESKPSVFERITYKEDKPDIAPSEEEKNEKMVAEELEYLGSLGFKNVQNEKKFLQNIDDIEKAAKEICQKVYIGEAAKLLTGPEKLPEYLINYLIGMRKNALEFRLSSIRALRESSENLQKICVPVTHAVFSYVFKKFTYYISSKENDIYDVLAKQKKINAEKRGSNLRKLRPNLSNPACKDELLELVSNEKQRYARFNQTIDDIEIELIDTERNISKEFYIAFLNNMRALKKILDNLLMKPHFIKLPGGNALVHNVIDDIVDKKHKNLKILTTKKEQNGDEGKRFVKVWKGFGQNPFNISLTTMLQDYQHLKPVVEGTLSAQADLEKNEILSDLEVPNTDWYKSLMKNRNEYFASFSQNFKEELDKIIAKFKEDRVDESKFSENWRKNLKELRFMENPY